MVVKLFFYARRFQKEAERIVRKKYYPAFKEIDSHLRKSYLFRSPYRLCEIKPYGETPLPTLEKILTWAELGPKDRYVELGAGRGRGALFVSQYFGCPAWAVEQSSIFSKKAMKLIQTQQVPNITWMQSDFLLDEIPKGDVTYLYGTTLLGEEICLLGSKIEVGTKLISISYPFSDYLPGKFQDLGSISVAFPWGDTRAYLQRRID